MLNDLELRSDVRLKIVKFYDEQNESKKKLYNQNSCFWYVLIFLLAL